MKRLFKTLLFVFLFLIVSIALYAGFAFVFSRISTASEPGNSKDVTIYIVTNGVHTDIAMPLHNELADWRSEIKFSNTLKKDTLFNYVAMGWGDKGFYLDTPTWADLRASTAFKATFGLSTSAIHTTFYKELKEDSTCVKLTISKNQYARLVKYVKSSFKQDQQGHYHYIKTNANYGSNDAFYDAEGSYSLFHTCNTWANNALKSCGQKASFWTPFDTGIFYHYKH